MCILCVASKLSRRIITMLPWLVIPLILVWAFSQLLPPNFRFEVTSPRLACVFVLLISIGWYEVVLPSLSAWQAHRSALIREKERVEAQMAAKLRKEAVRRCRNCLTAYRDQNPANGRFMCAYCGHISRRPVLDMNPIILGKGVSITENYWRIKNNAHSFQASICSEKCSSEKTTRVLTSITKILEYVMVIFKWFPKYSWGKKPCCNGRCLHSSYDENSFNKDNKSCYQETRVKRAKRKAEEKRQARLQKQMQEEEERRQREEVAQLVEEQRRLRNDNLEARMSLSREVDQKMKRELHKGRATVKQCLVNEKQGKVKAPDNNSHVCQAQDIGRDENQKVIKENVHNNKQDRKSNSKRNMLHSIDSSKALKTLGCPLTEACSTGNEHMVKENGKYHVGTYHNFGGKRICSTPSGVPSSGSPKYWMKSSNVGSAFNLSGTSGSRCHAGPIDIKHGQGQHSAWNMVDSSRLVSKAGLTKEYSTKKTVVSDEKGHIISAQARKEHHMQQPVGSELRPVSPVTSHPNSWQHLFRRPEAHSLISCPAGKGSSLEEQKGGTTAVQTSSTCSFYSGMFDAVEAPESNLSHAKGSGTESVSEPSVAYVPMTGNAKKLEQVQNTSEGYECDVTSVSESDSSVASICKPSSSPNQRNNESASFMSNLSSKENNVSSHIGENDHPPIIELWSLPSLSLECSNVFSAHNNRQIWDVLPFEKNKPDNPWLSSVCNTARQGNLFPVSQGSVKPFIEPECSISASLLSSSENIFVNQAGGNLSSSDEPLSHELEHKPGLESSDKLDGHMLVPNFIIHEDEIEQSFDSADNNESEQFPAKICPM